MRKKDHCLLSPEGSEERATAVIVRHVSRAARLFDAAEFYEKPENEGKPQDCVSDGVFGNLSDGNKR